MAKPKQGYVTGRDFEIIQIILKEPISTIELAEKLAISPKSLWNRLNWLEKTEFIERVKTGRNVLVRPKMNGVLWSILAKTFFSDYDSDNVEVDTTKITFHFPEGLMNSVPLEYVAIGDILLSSKNKRKKVGPNKEWVVINDTKK